MVEYGMAPGSTWVAQDAKNQQAINYTMSAKEMEEAQIPMRGKPRPVPRYSLPPPLTKELHLRDVSKLWRQEDYSATQLLQPADANQKKVNSSSSCYQTRCPFSWVVGTSDVPINSASVEQYFTGITKEMNNWVLEDGKKVGFVPQYGANPVNNTLTWEFASLQQEIASITLFYMKSYGEKFDGSTVRMKAFLPNPTATTTTATSAAHRRLQEQATAPKDDQTPIIVKEFDAFHLKQTSELYTETMKFPTPLSTGDTLRLSFSLIRGNSFKIQGITVCS